LGPLIPYVEVPELPLGFISIKPFGTVVALGVYVGSVIAMRHARERGIDEKKQSEFIFWVLVGAFTCAHMLDAVFYHPTALHEPVSTLRTAFRWLGGRIPGGDLARSHPHLVAPLYILMLWEGLSSYGGFVGAAIGAFTWRWRRREPITKFVEMFTSAFPLAWVFGRTGCAMVHDHPGRLSDAWFAVRWPMTGGVSGRYDLGLYEMVLTIPLAVTFLVLWRKKPFRPLGFYTGWMCVAYAPVRFLLDFLREQEGEGVLGGDPRYGGLTPAQWGCFGLFALGLYFLRMASRPESATAPRSLDGGHPHAPGVDTGNPPAPGADEGGPPEAEAAEGAAPPSGGEPAP
jgi:phosphatidylglycerol---prolipoprotein diacylglyceryl transferase